MLYLLLALLTMTALAQPADPAAIAREARQQLAARNYPRAAELYRKLIAQVPNVAGLRLNLGLALFQAGDHRAAAGELQTALKMEPGLTPASILLGVCYAKLGEPALAIPPLERAVKAQPENALALLELADANYATGRLAPAIEYFRQLAKLQPANPLAWRGLGLSLSEHSQALFQKLSPQSAEALTLLGRSKLEQQEPKAAFQLLRQAIARDPSFGPAHGYLAELYRRNGRADWAAVAQAKAGPGSGIYAEVVAASEQALEALGKLEALGPTAELLETQAEAARARGAYPEAVEALRKALAVKAGNAVLERSFARALFLNRNYEEAIPLLTKYKMSYELGAALVESGRAAEAIPHLLAIRTAAAQAQLGRAYLETDQPAKAIGPLRAGLVTDADGSLHFQLARALQRTGAAAQAREMDRMSQEIRQQRAREQEALGAVTITPP
jgi:tetratricopeptide (TPR) repeat protein